MFEGSDLSVAYATYEQPPQSQQQQPQPQPQPQQPHVSQKPQMVSLQQPMDIQYTPPDAMYMSQKPPTVYYEPREGFFDRFASKKYDILKVVSFALIIVLAIAIDRFTTFYISQYVADSVLTTTQEVFVRIAYPIVILLVIWLLKLV